jgi:hypothetical protein
MRNNEKLWKQIESVRHIWNGMKSYENLWKSMEGSSWQSMDINGNCHNSLEVHGCPRKRVDISYNKCGAERWGQTNVFVFNEPDTIASQPAPPHRPRAYRGRPRCAWSWFWRSWAIPEINDYHGWIWPPVSLCSINYWGSVGVLGPSRGPTADPSCPLSQWKGLKNVRKRKQHMKRFKKHTKLWKLWRSNRMEKTENTRITDRN